MEAIKNVLPAAFEGEQARSDLALKLDRFAFERILSQGTTSPYIYLLGKIDDEPAIVHLQRVAFDVPESSGARFSLVSQLDKVNSLEKNDIYEWAQGWYGPDRAADVKVNIIHPCTATHIRKYSAQKRFMINETPEVYRDIVKPYIDSFPPSRIQWVYNVLEHKKEADKIVYEDKDPETGFMILPDMKWDGKTLSALYLTAIVHTHRLKSIRDLRPSDLALLRKIKQAGESVVQEKYGMQRGGTRLFLHYQPSYYHLHVHIVSLTNEGLVGADVGKAHLLDDVISLLEQSSSAPGQDSLLQRMTLTYHLGEEDGLYKALIAAGVDGQAQDSSVSPEATRKTISQASRAAWDADADLPICTACGTQYPAPRDECPICEDERQFVPATGQTWSSLRKLVEAGHKNELIKDTQDERISYIKTTPSFGIGQTPFLIETANGSYIWDCCAFLSESLILELQSLKTPLKGIIVSHPHFYTTSLTWSRVLKVPLFISAKDKHWFQRLSDETWGEIVWYPDDMQLTSSLKVLRCGGHFEGSAVLYWDRSAEPSPPCAVESRTRQDGIVFCADTAMVQPTQKGFTFQYSVPNMIPLNPYDVAYLYKKLKDIKFGQATSTWPGHFIREDADTILAQSVRKHLESMGCDWLWTSLSAETDRGPAGSTSWNSTDIMSPRATTSKARQSLIILNQPITRRDIFEKLWNNCEYRICADGGANRLYDLLDGKDRERFLPDAIKGDLDSLRDDVRDCYENKGTRVIHDESEYSTDLQKCIEHIDSLDKKTNGDTVIILGGLSGRLDQTTHVLALLQKLRRGSKGKNLRDQEASNSAWQGSDFKVYMGDELVSDSRGQDLYKSFGRGDGSKDIRVVSENCVAWVLDAGEHVIEIDHETYGPTCGVLPLGVESSHVETKGLRWDFDWQTAFSTQISTSNHLDPNYKSVIIRTSRPVWWTMEVRDLADVQSNQPMQIPLSMLSDDSFGFLTTMRVSVTDTRTRQVPLLERHLDRLRSAWTLGPSLFGQVDTGRYPPIGGPSTQAQINDFNNDLSPGEYRIRAVLSTRGQLDLQAIPLPASSPSFTNHPDEAGIARYDVLMNPESSKLDEAPEALYRYKTTSRSIYEEPLLKTKRAAEEAGINIPFDTILHWQQPGSKSMEDDLVSETSFANLAIHLPLADGGGPEWLTPEESATSPFLPGVMRGNLIEQGILRTGRVTVRDLRKWVAEGRRVIGMNGLRGVWEANILSLPEQV